MKLDRVLGTVAVWGGVALLSYLFNSFNILDGAGAGCMAFAAFVLTFAIWKD